MSTTAQDTRPTDTKELREKHRCSDTGLVSFPPLSHEGMSVEEFNRIKMDRHKAFQAFLADVKVLPEPSMIDDTGVSLCNIYCNGRSRLGYSYINPGTPQKVIYYMRKLLNTKAANMYEDLPKVVNYWEERLPGREIVAFVEIYQHTYKGD